MKRGPTHTFSRQPKTIQKKQEGPKLMDTRPFKKTLIPRMHLLGPSGNEQWEPEPALRPCPDKQTPTPAAVRPHAAASHLQKKKKKKQFILGHSPGFQSSHGCCVVNRIHISADIQSFRTSSQSPEWQLFFFSSLKQTSFCFRLFSTKSLSVGILHPPPPCSLCCKTSLFYKKQTKKKKRLEETTVNAVKIDKYYPNILKHRRKGLNFSLIKRGIIWLGHHTRSDLLSLNDVCYRGLHECMHVVHHVYVWCVDLCFSILFFFF